MACIFLAGKTEENFIQIKDLYLISNKYSEEQILNAEKTLLDVLTNLNLLAANTSDLVNVISALRV